MSELPKLRPASVHCVVTSPPYWGLRDYGVPKTKWPTGWVGCHGLEPTIDLYVEHAVLIFREVHRVLRADGTLWLNLGDTYAGGGLGGGGGFAQDGVRMAAEPGTNKNVPGRSGTRLAGGGIKAKDLVGVPWRVALALQADGWHLRCDNVWHKPNPMPESCQDRPTKAHEYVFLFSKSPRYFYDLEAVKEPVTGNSHPRCGMNSPENVSRDFPHKNRGSREKGKRHVQWALSHPALVSKRNKRSVWTVATAPYRGAHFATFPTKLIEPCILAGTSEAGCCQRCETPLRRVVERGAPDREHQRQCGGDENGNYFGKATKDFAKAGAQNASEVKARILAGLVERRTIGWEPGCKCPNVHVFSAKPCVVLDPFGGSGTVAEVAQQYRRDAILIELNGKYLPMIRGRLAARTIKA